MTPHAGRQQLRISNSALIYNTAQVEVLKTTCISIDFKLGVYALPAQLAHCPLLLNCTQWSGLLLHPVWALQGSLCHVKIHISLSYLHKAIKRKNMAGLSASLAKSRESVLKTHYTLHTDCVKIESSTVVCRIIYLLYMIPWELFRQGCSCRHTLTISCGVFRETTSVNADPSALSFSITVPQYQRNMPDCYRQHASLNLWWRLIGGLSR